MYLISVKVAKSDIHGRGVFTNEKIPKGKIVWKFRNSYDIKLSQKEYDVLSESRKQKIQKVGYLSPWSGYWVLPPEGDPAEYTNHNSQNNLSVIFDRSVSAEPYFVANRDIRAGEELTNNYSEFDKITQNTNPSWTT